MQTRATINGSLAERVGLTRAFGPRPAGAVAKPPASSAAAALSNLKVRTPPSPISIQIQFSRQNPTNCRNILAERVGFEPTNTVRCYTLSRRAPSTARPPLHKPLLKLHPGWDCSRLRRESSASLRTDAFASSKIAGARFCRTHEHG